MRLKLPNNWKGFVPFIWHGFFLAVTMAMIEPNTVLPALVSNLTSNTVQFGLVYSILLGAPLLFNLPFSHFQQRFATKRRFLLIGIYTRSLSFLGMALTVLWWGKAQPALAFLILVILILIFSASGGFAGIAYTDMVGRTIPVDRRPTMYAVRQVFAGVGSLIGGFVLTWLFRPGSLAFPNNYSVGLEIGAVGLLIGAAGFWMIREPALPASTIHPITNIQLDTVGANLAEAKKPGFFSILKHDRSFRQFIIVENLSGFSLMLLPFYMMFITARFPQAKEWLGVFMIAQTVGAVGSNFVWAGLARRFSPRMVIRLCMLVGGLIPLLALAMQHLGLPWFTLLFLLIGFVLSGRNIGFEPYLLEIAPEEQRTLYLGIRGSLSILVAFLPLAGGFLISLAGPELVFLVVAVLMIGSAGLADRKHSIQ